MFVLAGYHSSSSGTLVKQYLVDHMPVMFIVFHYFSRLVLLFKMKLILIVRILQKLIYRFQEVFHFVLAFCGFVFLKTLIKEFNFDRLFFGSKLEQLIHFSLRYGVGNNACLVILLLLRLP